MKIRTAPGRPFRRSFTSIAVLLIAWEIAGRYVLTNRLFFVPISSVVVAAVEMWKSGQLQTDIAASLSAVGYGMMLAIIAGIAIGVLSGAKQAFREYN